MTTREINSDLDTLVCWGRSGVLSSSLPNQVFYELHCLQDHLSLVMECIPIVEAETMSVLGFHFDHRLT